MEKLDNKTVDELLSIYEQNKANARKLIRDRDVLKEKLEKTQKD